MKQKKVTSKEGNLHIWREDNFEFVNPWERLKKSVVDVSLRVDSLHLENELGYPDIPPRLKRKILIERAEEKWLDKKTELKSVKVPIVLKQLLTTNKKRDQKKLLKGLTIRSSELLAFFLYAFDEYDFAYSMYTSEYHKKGIRPSDVPTATLDAEKNVRRFEDSDFSDGEIRQMIEHRKFHVARFIDNHDVWHCFFYSFKSIGGRELPNREERPHIHYISNAWGFSREFVLKQILSRKYNLGSTPHLDYLRNE